MKLRIALFAALCAVSAYAGGKLTLKKPQEPSALDRYIEEATKGGAPAQQGSSNGSTWTAASRLTDIGSDIRASQVNDLVTIVVAEQASAVATGDLKSSRASSLNSSISSLAGPKSATGAFNNLAQTNTAFQLAGAGSTSRGSQLSTTLSARVTHVLPNGYLVVEGTKEVQVNAEHQEVTVRGIIRTTDLSPSNFVSSNQIAQLEIRINGKGVVGDVVRRPFILYRLILGLLPF